MAEAEIPTPEAPKHPQLSAADQRRQNRFAFLIQSLRKFERGKQMVDWMKNNAVQPVFFDPEDNPNLTDTVTHYDRKEAEDGTVERILYINEKAPFAETIVSVLNQVRRAWHMEQDVYKENGLNHLSALCRARISEADRRSFTVAMAQEYTKASGDFSVINHMYHSGEYDVLLDAASDYSSRPGVDFTIIRRAVFDAFFQSQLQEILDFERKNTEKYIDSLGKAIDRKTEAMIREHMMLPRPEDIRAIKPEVSGGQITVPSDKPAGDQAQDEKPANDDETQDKKATFNKAATRYDPLILDYGIKPLKSLTADEIASLTLTDFDPEGENFLTGLQMQEGETPAQYMVTSGEVAELMQTFSKRYGSIFAGVNFLEGPSPLSVEDTMNAVNHMREQQAAAEAAALAQQEAKKAAEAPQKAEDTAKAKAPKKKRGWFGRRKS